MGKGIELNKELLLNPDNLNQHVGKKYLKELDWTEDVYVRECLFCGRVFFALGKFNRTCRNCLSSKIRVKEVQGEI